MPARIPNNEAGRIAALNRYQILDTLPEDVYDDLATLASEICETPIALVSLVDHDRQWFKSKIGVDLEQTSRDDAFCAHAILKDELFIVPDALADERFNSNPLVTDDPHFRFYAGSPLITPNGFEIGTLCVIDREPRQLAPNQQEALRILSRQIVAQMELQVQNAELRRANVERQKYVSLIDLSHDFVAMADLEGNVIYINPAGRRLVGLGIDDEIKGTRVPDYHPQEDAAFYTEEVLPATLDSGLWEGETKLVNLKTGKIAEASQSVFLVRDPVGNHPMCFATVARDITGTVRVQARQRAFADLTEKLSSARGKAEASQIIADVTDELLTWDAFCLDLVSTETGEFTKFLSYDIIDGKRCKLSNEAAKPALTPRMLRTIERGSELVLRDKTNSPINNDGFFGDKSRPSESLMFAPIRRGSEIVGVISAQSYKPSAYDESDLAVFQGLADLCSGAFQRINAETAQQESQERFDLAVRGSTDAIWDWPAPPGDEVWWTPRLSEMLGYEHSELVPSLSLFRSFLHADDVDQTFEAIDAHLQNQSPYDVEFRLRTKGNDYRWFRSRGQALWDGHGRPMRMSGSLQDITERKQFRMELIQSKIELEKRVTERTKDLERANRELINEVRYRKQAEAERRDYAERLVQVQEAERRFIAHELHDEIGQELTGLTMLLNRIAGRTPGLADNGLIDATQLIGGLMDRVRQLSLDLRPRILDDLGLMSALNWYFKRYLEKTGISVDFHHNITEERFKANVETIMFRIIQEALTNVARHANVETATVRLWKGPETLRAQIEDLGRGFDAEAAMSSHTSTGLLGMKERALLMNGDFVLEAAENAGSSLTVELPVAPAVLNEKTHETLTT